MDGHFTSPPAAYESLKCSISSLTLGMISLFNLRLLNRCPVLPCCGFDLHFLNGWWYWASFVVIGHPCIFFDGISVQIFFSCFKVVFVFLLLSFKCSLHILDTSFFYQIKDLQIFSSILVLFFRSLHRAFQRAKVLNFYEVWFINFFMDCAFHILSK